VISVFSVAVDLVIFVFLVAKDFVASPASYEGSRRHGMSICLDRDLPIQIGSVHRGPDGYESLQTSVAG
jgi:hypothetical protein